jgi:molecular chaperone IbpA|tara:strand:- start:1006 stop:1461 length:456 start_codon:yes stop_codon:yes gene_type:complete
MTNSKAIQSMFTGLKPFTVGFDDMFNHFDHMVDHLPHMTAANSYPPYDIVKTGSLTYDIQVALAGYSKKDISISFEDNILKIESVKSKDEKEVEDNEGVLHRGIAKRNFSKGFTIADDVKIIGAELKDGLLKVSLEKIVPDHKKARTINIK